MSKGPAIAAVVAVALTGLATGLITMNYNPKTIPVRRPMSSEEQEAFRPTWRAQMRYRGSRIALISAACGVALVVLIAVLP